MNNCRLCDRKIPLKKCNTCNALYCAEHVDRANHTRICISIKLIAKKTLRKSMSESMVVMEEKKKEEILLNNNNMLHIEKELLKQKIAELQEQCKRLQSINTFSSRADNLQKKEEMPKKDTLANLSKETIKKKIKKNKKKIKNIEHSQKREKSAARLSAGKSSMEH